MTFKVGDKVKIVYPYNDKGNGVDCLKKYQQVAYEQNEYIVEYTHGNFIKVSSWWVSIECFELVEEKPTFNWSDLNKEFSS